MCSERKRDLSTTGPARSRSSAPAYAPARRSLDTAATGRFVEVTLIRNDADLEQFLRDYGFDKSEIKYEW